MAKIEASDRDGRLTEFMCFAIYSANLAYSRVYKLVLENLGLTYPQYVTLIALWEEDYQTVKALSEKLFLEPSTVTPMLKRLDAMGYVTQTRGRDDERIVRTSLTPNGLALRETAFDFDDITRSATGLSPEEFSILQTAIVNLRGNLVTAARPT